MMREGYQPEDAPENPDPPQDGSGVPDARGETMAEKTAREKAANIAASFYPSLDSRRAKQDLEKAISEALEEERESLLQLAGAIDHYLRVRTPDGERTLHDEVGGIEGLLQMAHDQPGLDVGENGRQALKGVDFP